MAYATTTINSATPAADLATWLNTQLTANGWEFVETVKDAVPTITAGHCGYMYHLQSTTPLSGTATSATSTTLTRTGSTWYTGGVGLGGYTVTITGGTGSGQSRTITSNTSTVLTVPTWDVTPDATSTFVITASVDIYKSPAASNSLNTDFYVSITTGGVTEFHVGIFEEWNTSTKVKTKYAPGTGVGKTIHSAGYVDDAGVNAVTHPGSRVTTVASQANVIHLTVDADRIILGNVASEYGFFYAGIFDSFLTPTADPMPLVVMNYNTSYSAGNNGVYTREPGAPSATQNNFQGVWGGNPTGLTTYRHSYGPVPNSNDINFLNSSDVYRPAATARVWIATCRGSSSGYSARGIVRDVVTSRSGGLKGDTLSVTDSNGVARTYVMVSGEPSATPKLFVPSS